MSQPDRPVLRSRDRIHDVLLQATAQSRRNVHRKQSETPMSAAEFRWPLLSFCCGSGNATQPSLRIFAGKLGEMSIKQPLIDARFYAWIIGLRLNFLKDAPQFKSIAMSNRLEHLPGRNTQESVLCIDGEIFQKKVRPSV